jgi:transposase InsO family protein
MGACGAQAVERLMRAARLRGVQKRRFHCTTRPGHPERVARTLVVKRYFNADRPNALWLADVTYGTPRRCRPPPH